MDWGLNRRKFLAAFSATAFAVGGCAEEKGEPTRRRWSQWLKHWRRMEQIALRRQWKTIALRIDPPASPHLLAPLEEKLGLPFPVQLRTALVRHSARVGFGWYIPSNRHPLELRRFPTGSSFYDHVWDLGQLEKDADNFLGWKKGFSHQDVSEAPNRPEMWDNQFPIGTFANGDMLTIDVTRPDVQPVRYFSHELEGIHHHAVAPDFVSFVDVLSQLGWAGTEQDSWFALIGAQKGEESYLSTQTPVALAWRAYLDRDPATPEPDEPPEAVVEATAAERALLEAARRNDLFGVKAALALGARPDVVWNEDWLLDKIVWDEQFATALSYAAHADNIEMLEILVAKGATVNTRRLPMTDAIAFSDMKTLTWLAAHGARVNGWTHERLWPLHHLMRWHGNPESLLAIRANREKLVRENPYFREFDWGAPKPISREEYLARFDFLLDRGADPNRVGENGWSPLAQCGVETSKRLIAHGADVDARDHSDLTPLHWARDPAKVRLLVEHGARIDARATPPADDSFALPATVLQWHVMSSYQRDPGMIDTLLALGADPKLRDGAGRSILFYCNTVEDFERFRPLFDPFEKLPDGGTLLHHLASVDRAGEGLFDHLLKVGLPINARDVDGKTVLHVVVERELTKPALVAALLAKGADKTIRDNAGRTPCDRAPPSRDDLKALLKV